ncbi:MAG: hypothetical protein WAV55_09555 [Clostridiaceae bacterium]
MVYICAIFSGDINTLVARHYSRFAADKSFIPIAPHLLFNKFLDESLSAKQDLGLFFRNVAWVLLL